MYFVNIYIVNSGVREAYAHVYHLVLNVLTVYVTLNFMRGMKCVHRLASSQCSPRTMEMHYLITLKKNMQV